ncbi:MAG TPA: LytR C-terminal domain-containing protein [Thermoleophilaceae bacterium]|jgi:hypothetical protein
MHLVQEIGSYAGFAAVVGLAVLSALYFSQARDVKRLREWAGRAPERAAEEEARISAQAQAQATQQQRAAAGAGAGTVAAPAVRPQTAPAPPPSGVPAPPPPTLPTSRPTPAPASTSSILGNVQEQDPWYRRINWPAPRYIVLIVVGVLVIGAGAAYGVSQLTKSDSGTNGSAISANSGSGGGGSSSSSSTSKSKSKKSHKAPAVNPSSVTVAVLNGTTVQGLAATVANKLDQDGFTPGNTNNALTQGQQAESVVEYSDNNEKAARLVGDKLGITQIEKIDPQTQTLAGDATVTVIIGADKANSIGG